MEHTIFGIPICKSKGLVLLRRYERSDGTPKYLPIGDEIVPVMGTNFRDIMTNVFQEQVGYYEEHWSEFAILGNRDQREYFFTSDMDHERLTRFATGSLSVFEYTDLPKCMSPTLKWLIDYLWINRFDRTAPIYVPTISWENTL